MDDAETLHRRARYRELLRECFSDSPSKLLNHIAARGFKANQGEISALKKDGSSKSFGDVKARVLAEQIGLHRRWFDWPLGAHLERQRWALPLSQDEAPQQEADPVSMLPTEEQSLITAYRLASEETRENMLALASNVLARQKASQQGRRKVVMPGNQQHADQSKARK
jgi:hypothetical protein